MSQKGGIATRLGNIWFGGGNSPSNKNSHKESPILITIDLGASGLRAMVAKIDAQDKIHILGAVNTPIVQPIVEDGIVRHSTRMASLIEDCFSQLAPIINHYRGTSKRKKNEPFSSVFVSIGGSTLHDSFQASTRQFHLGHKVSEQDLEDMKEECSRHAVANGDYPTIYQAEAIEHIIDETQQTTEPLGKPAESLSSRYHFLVGEPQMKEKLAEAFARIGNLALEQAFCKGAALGYAILSEEEYQQGCAILDFGASTTSLYIYHNSHLIHSVSLPYGSSLITQDISSLGLLPSTAEKLKLLKGRAMEQLVTTDVKVHCRSAQTGEDIYIKQTDLCYIIECRLDEIFESIFRTISEYSDRINNQIYLTGMGSELQGFDQYIAGQTGCEVSYASHTDWLAEDTPKDKYADPAYTQLIGTTLLASDYLENAEPQQRPVIKTSTFQQTAIDFFGGEH